MANNSNGNFWRDIVRILFFLIVIYYGGWGWGAVFSSDNDVRHKWGAMNIKIMFFEVLFVLLFFVFGNNNPPSFSYTTIMTLLVCILIQTILSFLGLIIGLFIYLLSKND